MESIDCTKCGNPTTTLKWWNTKRVCEDCYQFEHDCKYLGDLSSIGICIPDRSKKDESKETSK